MDRIIIRGLRALPAVDSDVVPARVQGAAATPRTLTG